MSRQEATASGNGRTRASACACMSSSLSSINKWCTRFERRGLSAALDRHPRPIGSEVFCGPMAHAIVGGLFVATLLSLLFPLPLCVAWFRIE